MGYSEYSSIHPPARAQRTARATRRLPIECAHQRVTQPLRLRLSDDATWCPFCGEIMDPFGDHFLVCACAGDRMVSHSRFRKIFWEESRAAGLPTDKEKANLLPDRPSEEGDRHRGEGRPTCFGRGGSSYLRRYRGQWGCLGLRGHLGAEGGHTHRPGS